MKESIHDPVFEFSPNSGLIGLAASAFLSATLLPGNSEIVLVGVLAKYPHLLWPAIAIATVANTLGGMTSYIIGRVVPNKAQGKALVWLKKYGVWALLLSWVPLVGDALCVAAGWVRLNPWLTLLMMAIGKGARYLLIAGALSMVAQAAGN